MRIPNKSLFSIDGKLRTKLCKALSEESHHSSRINRIDEHRSIKFHIPVNKWGKPVSLKYIRICIGKYRSNICISYLKLGCINSYHRRGDHILYVCECFFILLFAFSKLDSILFCEFMVWVLNVLFYCYIPDLYYVRSFAFYSYFLSFFIFLIHQILSSNRSGHIKNLSIWSERWRFKSLDISGIVFCNKFRKCWNCLSHREVITR